MHIAITGSMGSGKSEVSRMIKDLGYPVISSDEVVDELLKRDEVKAELVKLLGSKVLNTKNEIDKAYLSFRIFNNTSEKESVETLLHPLVYARLMDFAKLNQRSHVFSEVPLLFETHGQKSFDQSLLIICDEAIALERLVSLRHVSIDEAKRRLSHQMSVEQKKKMADTTLENNGSLSQLKEKVIQYLHTLTL